MDTLLKLGWAAGIGGALLCLLSVAFRLSGAYWIGGFQLGTLLQAGTATMVFGCFCQLAVLAQKARTQ